MKYLLDTCAYYWMVDDQSQLSNVALKAMGEPNNLLYVSVIALTELHRLIRKGKISIHTANGLAAWFRKGLIQHRVMCEPITLEVMHLAETLPAIHHDPAVSPIAQSANR
jgi:PIN domain nuclease of toxin-antitoxin system